MTGQDELRLVITGQDMSGQVKRKEKQVRNGQDRTGYDRRSQIG